MKALLPALALLTWTLGVFVAFDALYAVSLSSTWTVLAVLVGWMAAAAYSSQASRVGFLVLCLLFTAGTVGVRWLNETSRKPFLRDFQRIHRGMTRAQVEARMGRYLHGAARPGDEAVYGSSRASDAEWARVRFHEDRVVELGFVPEGVNVP